MTVPLQWVNEFLRAYDVGQVLFVVFALGVLGAAVATRSVKVVALYLLVFGALFVIVPSHLAPGHWRFFGYVMLVVAPVAFVLAED